MDYLGKSAAPFSEELWEKIGGSVVLAARETLVGRRFLPLYGPLGPGATLSYNDDITVKKEQHENGFAVMAGRKAEQIPELYEDFWLYWRDLAMAEREGTPVELGAAMVAAQNLALREDRMILYGIPSLSIAGLLTAKGVTVQKRSDWSQGEGAYTDVAAGIAALLEKGRIGRHSLIVSQDLFVQLQRIQPGTGVLESHRLGKLLDKRIYTTPVLKPGTAALVCAQPQYMDLVVGQDIAVAYAETDENLNHHLRVLETALPRIKAPSAIVLFK